MKFLFYKSFVCILFFSIVSKKATAQQSDIDANALSTYNKGVLLFNNKAYAAAQHLFSTIHLQEGNYKNLQADASYFDAMCAIKLRQTSADKKVLDFVEKHPNSTKKDKAFLNVGHYYFANKNATYALKWYSKVNSNLLSKENKNEFNFKMGYALLTTGNLSLAKQRFLPLINNPKYGNDARYYYGFIAYKQEDYDIAEATLKEIADDESYKGEITYYLLDMSFKAGKFEKCITVGEKLLKSVKQKEKSEISKIVGESYFNLEQYQKAIPYLSAYKGKRGKWTNTDYYLLGYAYYKQNDFKNASTYFTKIIDQKNNVSQNAYYHLAQCYLKSDKKTEALLAFKSASEMDFDVTIKEDAALNYAKLSYEEGNPYKSVAAVLQDFLIAYPKSPSYNEINGLIVTSFLFQKNYQGALDYLAKNNSIENKRLTNEVSLYRGIQLYNLNSFQKSLPYFTVASASQDLKIKQKAIYWKGETAFQLRKYTTAIADFLNFTKISNSENNDESKQVNYTIAYSYFKLKEYKNAAIYFQRYLNQNTEDMVFTDDAIIRLGDCYFATKNYKKAINSYKTIIDNLGLGADYAYYQAAMSYGFLGDNQQKIATLNSLLTDFDTSPLLDDALYQLGNTYITVKENQNAHLAYNNLIKNHSKSSYIPNTLLREGLVYYNENNNAKALNYFKQVVAKYPNSNEAKQAVINAKNVYIDDGNIAAYAIWAKTISFVNVTNAELDNATYQAAENKFLDNNKEKALEGFTQYTKNFPTGLHALKANYYLAKLLFESNQKEKSVPFYNYVVQEGQSEFSEESLNKLSQLYLENDRWELAIPLLERLEIEANYAQNILYAQSNLMKGYYQSNQYEKAVMYAEKVLLNDAIEATVEYDAKIIIARSAFKTDDLQTAEEFYLEIERNATGVLKAEALFYSAYFKNSYKEYTDSNKVIQKLASEYAAYKFWGLKGLIVMAKNQYALKDAYQATYILENVIKNATKFEDVLTEAKNELKIIKNNEAKTNNSVTPQND